MTPQEHMLDGNAAVRAQHSDEKRMANRAAISSIAGSALEWLDFAAYGAIAATVLPQLFFSSTDPTTAALAAFATFSVGFVARPLGGLICGYLGDRVGRRNMLVFTFLLMGICSFLIGVLPTYASIGVLAPVALVTLRFMQGFALGGEVTGSQLLTMEHAPKNRRGFYSSFIAMGSPLAQVLANAVLFTVAALVTNEQFLRFGWRIPFLFSFLLVAIGLFIRMRISETPAFEAQRKQKRTGRVEATPGFGKHGGTILRLMMVWAAVSIAYFIATVFILSYVTSKLGVSKQTAFAVLIVAHLCSMIAMGVGGALCDRMGRRRAMLIGSRSMLAAFVVFFPLILSGHILLIGLAIVFLLCAAQFHAGVQPAYFAEAFPTEFRYRGSAVAYNLAVVIGSSAPFAATLIQAHTAGATWPIVALGVVFNLISMWAIHAGAECYGE
ncbi:major facilitator transporter [Caballeronia temeraria]|uniref:Major facilitator transporter n=1 Tax=Caballeronia temeraria TaxID=1777137 RepID=A0A158CJM4_9BURK|nr:MFS transporter [Caballeronia temeraria]SAK82480.1 major facilitator transporter [Caballeronia temeraria]